ncbi:AAC(3) family N-acetyltransferase [Nonomuraea sp. NPDC002799]
MINYARLSHDFAVLGVRFGQVILVHSSLSSLGHVDGGASTVVSALRDLIGGEGTLVVPTGTRRPTPIPRRFIATRCQERAPTRSPPTARACRPSTPRPRPPT